MKKDKSLHFCTCGARAKDMDTEGVQCIGPRMGLYVSILYVITFMPLIIQNTETYTVFLTNSLNFLVISAVRFCPHDVFMYLTSGFTVIVQLLEQSSKQRSCRIQPSTFNLQPFAIQTYGCFSFIEYVTWRRNAVFNWNHLYNFSFHISSFPVSCKIILLAFSLKIINRSKVLKIVPFLYMWG